MRRRALSFTRAFHVQVVGVSRPGQFERLCLSPEITSHCHFFILVDAVFLFSMATAAVPKFRRRSHSNCYAFNRFNRMVTEL